MAPEKIMASGLRLVRIETENNQSFTNKRLKIHEKFNLVMLSSLVKTLFRTDSKGEITERLWKKLEPKIVKEDYKRLDGEIFISAQALKKLVSQNSAGCPKSWGAFKTDGLAFILKELGDKADDDESSDEEESDSDDEEEEEEVVTTPTNKRKQSGAAQNYRNKKGKQVRLRNPGTDDDGEQDTSEGTLAALNEILLDKREEVLAEREEALDKRESIFHNRERKCRMGELLLKQEAKRLQTLEKELNKRESSVSQIDMNAFFDKISSITNQFKHKVSRSRGGSPVRGGRGKRAGSSPTPSGSDNVEGEQSGAKDKEENATAETLALMRAPSPIPSGSPSPSPIDESPIDI